MNSMTGIDMAVIYQAREKGLILQNIDYPCPAFVLVADR